MFRCLLHVHAPLHLHLHPLSPIEHHAYAPRLAAPCLLKTGQLAFRWRKRDVKFTAADNQKAASACSSLFIEPMEWMRGAVGDGEWPPAHNGPDAGILAPLP